MSDDKRVLTPHEQIARVFWRHLAQAPNPETVRHVMIRQLVPDCTTITLQGRQYTNPSTLDLYHNDVDVPDSDEWLADKIQGFIRRVL